jgi:hypothetical protein
MGTCFVGFSWNRACAPIPLCCYHVSALYSLNLNFECLLGTVISFCNNQCNYNRKPHVNKLYFVSAMHARGLCPVFNNPDEKN